MNKTLFFAIVLLLCSASGAWATTVTTSDSSSTADSLVCEAGTGGTTTKQCTGPISSSQVVTTGDTTSTPGHLVCEYGSGGKVYYDCGIAPITSISAYGMLANTTGSAAAPTVLTPTGSYGVPVLNGGTPEFTGGRVYFKNNDNSSSPSVIEMRNEAPSVNATANTIQSVFKNSAASYGTYGIIANVSTNITSGSEATRYDISTYTAGASNYELRIGNGVQSGAPTGGAKGVGTVNAAGAYYANGTAGVSCAAGTVSLATLAVTNGIVTHC